MTLHICTTGTSIAKGPIRDLTEADYKRRMADHVRDCRQAADSPEAFLTRLSAETNGLYRAGAGRGDEVCLLATDTRDGLLCAEKLARLIETEFNCQARVITVEGLQVGDARAFRVSGVPKLFEALDEAAGAAVQGAVINATGGFKGVVPFLVLYGMFNDIEVVYVYDFSDELIRLPVFPVEFDWNRLADAAEAILTVEEETFVSEERLKTLLPGGPDMRRRAVSAFFELYEGQYTLSAAGLLFFRRLKALTGSTPVKLSPAARTALEAPGGRAAFGAILDRVRNPLMRRLPAHAASLHTSDLKVWKRYTMAGPRMLYWVAPDGVHVAELFPDHARYDEFWKKSPRNIDDYDAAAFSEHAPGDGGGGADFLEDLAQMRLDAESRIEALTQEVEAVQLELHETRSALNAARTDLRRSIEVAVDKARREAQKAADEAAEMAEIRLNDLRREKDAEIAALQARLADLDAEAGPENGETADSTRQA